MLDLARDRGVDVDACLARFGITWAQMLEPEHRLPRPHAVAISFALARAISDPLVGLRVGERFELRDLDRVGYVLEHSANACAALEQLGVLSRLVSDALRFRTLRRGQRLVVQIGIAPNQTVLFESADGYVAIVRRIVSALTHGAAPLLHVALQRPRPARTGPYDSFFEVPIRYGAACGELEYPLEPLLQPLSQTDPRLCELLVQEAQRRIGELGREAPWIEAVRANIRRSIEDGAPSVGAVAAALRCSERTLRRRLVQNGTSYRSLLDEVRRDRALLLLNTGTLNVAQVAESLGFADSTVFARSFRRWTGLTPTAFLRAQRSGAPQPEARLGIAPKTPTDARRWASTPAGRRELS